MTIGYPMSNYLIMQYKTTWHKEFYKRKMKWSRDHVLTCSYMRELDFFAQKLKTAPHFSNL
jgi:hypothetical protein